MIDGDITWCSQRQHECFCIFIQIVLSDDYTCTFCGWYFSKCNGIHLDVVVTGCEREGGREGRREVGRGKGSEGGKEGERREGEREEGKEGGK